MTSYSSEAKRILPLIVFAQFACTSLWFAGNAVLPELQIAFDLLPTSVGHLTSSVQVGFILGTLIFAIFTISDRFSPSKVFLVCALSGAVINLSITLVTSSTLLFFLRGCVGFFLAGIYPVGMKISADYHEKGLGKALGYLVGALVVGTALPHWIRMMSTSLQWEVVMYTTSLLSIAGGCIVYFLVPDGPFRKKGSTLDLSACFTVFKEKKFRAAAFGYFGHMWELYTLWAFIPFILAKYNELNSQHLSVSLWSFLIIASGGIACVLGGYISSKKGSHRIAFAALFLSGICCLLSPLLFHIPIPIFLVFLIIWGMAVVADSPQFSTLIANYATVHSKGTALTIVNSIGFAITILSLQTMTLLTEHFNPNIIFVSLAIGPVLGLAALGRPVTTE